MRYALLIYNNSDALDQRSEGEEHQINAGVEEVLERPEVTGWLRLQTPQSASTLSHDLGRTLLTDGPFVDSKDFLGGFIVVEADNFDGAFAIANELQEIRGTMGPIEIRPVNEATPAGA